MSVLLSVTSIVMFIFGLVGGAWITMSEKPVPERSVIVVLVYLILSTIKTLIYLSIS